ncbi:retrotransposon protein, putative, ty1-copia subclass [Tanacetum coccineum]|uniref:Retrotransposon protein, putative, ty1-copia subclass n=1 Tax=Tanacetum coccineum TaxID=301880 RepID=A0ABQ5HXV7_9ASTR
MNSNVNTFKAHLVEKGYTQTYGVDYGETFSPAADIRVIRILLAITVFYDYKIWQMDVKIAFLNGHLSEDVYMVQPEGFVDPKHPSKKVGFTQNPDEPCVYLKASGSNVTFLVSYVDDILIMGNNVTMLQDVKSWLCKCFSMKDLGEAACILKIKIKHDRSKRLINLSQSTYFDKILKKFKMENSKRGSVPMQEKPNLSKAQSASTPSEVNLDFSKILVKLTGLIGAIDGLDGTERSIMGEPLSPDRVFDFPMDEPESHLAYDFFAPGPLPGYVGNPNNNNGWIEADVPLLGELGAEVDKPMVYPMIDELAEPIAALVAVEARIDVEEDIAMLFGDDDFSDDNSEGFEDDEEVWEVNREWLMAPVTPPSMLVVPPPSTYEVGGPSTAAADGQSFTLPAPGFPGPPLVIEDLSTCMGNLEYRHGQLVKKVIQVSDAEVADGIAIGEIGPRVSAVDGQVQTLQAAVQQRDVQIQQLQAMVSEMSSRESTLMQCILRMDKRLADLERRPQIMTILDYEFCVIVGDDALEC